MPDQPQDNKGNKPENKSPDVREPSNVRPVDKPTPNELPRRESGMGGEKESETDTEES